MVRAIGARIDQLDEHPRLGLRRPDIRPAARMLAEGPYLIFFETHPDTDDGPVDQVEIVRVVDARLGVCIGGLASWRRLMQKESAIGSMVEILLF
jgi:toxin ParE1/3/4